MAEIDDIRVALRLELDQFKQDLRSAKQEMQQAGDGMANSMKGVGGALSSVKSSLIALGAGVALKRAWDEFVQGERSAVRLDLALRNAGRGGEAMRAQMHELADSIGKVGVVSSTELKQGLAVLSSYTTISNRDLPRVGRVMADLAAQTGSVQQAARLLGQASEGMTAGFRRQNIYISAAAAESRNLDVILGEVEAQVRDMNRTLGETAGGGVERLKIAIGNLAEEFGKLISIPVTPIANGWTAVIQSMTDAFQRPMAHIRAYGESIKQTGELYQLFLKQSGSPILAGLQAAPRLLYSTPEDFAKGNGVAGKSGGKVVGNSIGAVADPSVEDTLRDATRSDLDQLKSMQGGLSATAGIRQQIKDLNLLRESLRGTREEKKGLFSDSQFAQAESRLWRQLNDEVSSFINNIADEASTMEAELTDNVQKQAEVRMSIKEREYKDARVKLALDLGASKEKIAAFDEAQKQLMAALDLQKQYAVEDKRIQTEAEYIGMLQQVRGEEAALSDDFQEAAKIRYDSRMDEIRLQEEQIWLALEFGKISGETANKQFAITEQLKAQAGQRLAKDSRTPLQELADDWANVTKQMNAATAKWAQQSVDHIIEFVKTGKFEFKSFAASIIEDLLRIQIQQALAGSGSSSTGNVLSLIGGLFGGAFASGGEPPLNRVSLVGEQGPELIAPKTAMMVTPLSQMTGGKSGPTVVVNNSNNFSLGVQQTVRAEIISLMPQITETSKRSVMTAINKGGTFSTAVGR